MPHLAVTCSLRCCAGASLELEDQEGNTALLVACSNGRKDAAMYLLDKGMFTRFVMIPLWRRQLQAFFLVVCETPRPILLEKSCEPPARM